MDSELGLAPVPQVSGVDSLPYGLRWRASYWFVTFVVGLGLATDLLVYSIIVVVIPFQLEKLGYSQISVLTSWLLFSYSGGMAISTLSVAILSERYDARKAPMILGIVVLIGAQIMLMEAPVYWLMCLARILQGIGSTMVWVVGFALLCDVTPHKLIGRQLGFAVTGVSLGLLVGPPVGGALYSRFGFRGPFIFGIIFATLDLASRLLIVEPKDALLQEMASVDIASLTTLSMNQPFQPDSNTTIPANLGQPSKGTVTNSTYSEVDKPRKEPTLTDFAEKAEGPTGSPNPRSFFSVLAQFGKSPRAIVATFLTFIFALLYTCIEPTLPLHMQSIWGWDSSKVGLVFLAAVVPAVVFGPVTGIIADKYGTAWITTLSFVGSLPWWGLMLIDNLPLFITSFGMSSFLLAGVIQSSLVAELAAVSRKINGVGYAHVYAAFNLAYGIGSSVGPIIGGQIYDHINKGWIALCLLAIGVLGPSILLSSFYIGDEPVLRQCRRLLVPQIRTGSNSEIV